MQTNELENLTHPLITAEHLTRIAIVYVRQTTGEQTPDNNRRIARQRNQTQLARQYGWPEHLIEVIDEDTGKPVHLRTGWQRMLDQIAGDRVGSNRSRHFPTVSTVCRVRTVSDAGVRPRDVTVHREPNYPPAQQLNYRLQTRAPLDENERRPGSRWNKT